MKAQSNRSIYLQPRIFRDIIIDGNLTANDIFGQNLSISNLITANAIEAALLQTGGLNVAQNATVNGRLTVHNITVNGQDLVKQLTTLFDQDITLQNNINMEIQARQSGDNGLQDQITYHVYNTNNPHGVTAHQAGTLTETEIEALIAQLANSTFNLKGIISATQPDPVATGMKEGDIWLNSAETTPPSSTFPWTVKVWNGTDYEDGTYTPSKFQVVINTNITTGTDAWYWIAGEWDEFGADLSDYAKIDFSNVSNKALPLTKPADYTVPDITTNVAPYSTSASYIFSDLLLSYIQKINGIIAGYVPGSTTVAGKALSSNVTLDNLNLQFNGTTDQTYNGNGAKTFNVTPSAIGAVPTSGDSTISGTLTATAFSGNGSQLTNLPPAAASLKTTLDSTLQSNTTYQLGSVNNLSFNYPSNYFISAIIFTASTDFTPAFGMGIVWANGNNPVQIANGTKCRIIFERLDSSNVLATFTTFE